MTVHLEILILHLKAGKSLKDPGLSSCVRQKILLSNPAQTAWGITQSRSNLQLKLTTGSTRTWPDLKQSLKPLKAVCDSDSPLFPENSCNMDGDCFACDASPHSPWSIFSSRRSGVGAGLLAHFAAHIAELFTNTSSIQTNFKNPPIQRFKQGICLSCLQCLFGSSSKKILVPAMIQSLGTLGGAHE